MIVVRIIVAIIIVCVLRGYVEIWNQCVKAGLENWIFIIAVLIAYIILVHTKAIDDSED